MQVQKHALNLVVLTHYKKLRFLFYLGGFTVAKESERTDGRTHGRTQLKACTASTPTWGVVVTRIIKATLVPTRLAVYV